MSSIRFSANLGFLWTDRPLPDAIVAAGAAGFDAVECHMPYDSATTDVRAALLATDLEMISLNTRLGEANSGNFGVAAMPGHEAEARSYIDEAIAYAAAIGCPNVSVVAGRTGQTAEAESVYRSNLTHATAAAKAQDVTILIEPISHRAVENYHLTHVLEGVRTIEAVGADNLKLMVDCFHTQITEGDLTEGLCSALPHIGHIQIAAVPDRGEPDAGEINYPWLLPHLVEFGYTGLFGAEYHPRRSLDEGLGWMRPYRLTTTGAEEIG